MTKNLEGSQSVNAFHQTRDGRVPERLRRSSAFPSFKSRGWEVGWLRDCETEDSCAWGYRVCGEGVMSSGDPYTCVFVWWPQQSNKSTIYWSVKYSYIDCCRIFQYRKSYSKRPVARLISTTGTGTSSSSLSNHNLKPNRSYIVCSIRSTVRITPSY